MEDKREIILEAASACIAESGLDGVSVKRIAERANVSPALIFYYFQNKESLALHVWKSAWEKLNSRSDGVDVQPGLANIHRKFRALWPERPVDMPPPSLFLELWAQASRNELLGRIHSARFQSSHAEYVAGFEADKKKGRLRPTAEPSLYADIIAALYYGFEIQICLDGLSPERAHDAAVRVLSLLSNENLT